MGIRSICEICHGKNVYHFLLLTAGPVAYVLKWMSNLKRLRTIGIQQAPALFMGSEKNYKWIFPYSFSSYTWYCSTPQSVSHSTLHIHPSSVYMLFTHNQGLRCVYLSYSPLSWVQTRNPGPCWLWIWVHSHSVQETLGYGLSEHGLRIGMGEGYSYVSRRALPRCPCTP